MSSEKPPTRSKWTAGIAALAAGLVTAVVVYLAVGSFPFAGVLDPNGIGILVYTAVLGGYSLHGFVHVGGSLVFRGYTPPASSSP